MNLSVLTCVLGEPESLIQTFESLAPSLSPELGWTVKFSTQTSDAFMMRISNPFVSCHRCPDSSLYGAMNQGLALLDSEYYFVIGAGDVILPSGVESLLSNLSDGNDDVAYFAPIVSASHGLLSPVPEELKSRMACPHPGSVLKTKNSIAIDGFDVGYKIAADYDHISRYVRKYGSGKVLSTPYVNFAAGGMSEIRAFEGTLEEELIRLRVWGAHEYSVHSRLMRRSTQIAASIFDQIAQFPK